MGMPVSGANMMDRANFTVSTQATPANVRAN